MSEFQKESLEKKTPLQGEMQWRLNFGYSDYGIVIISGIASKASVPSA